MNLPSFAEFYFALNGREPFPWQARLADLVSGEGGWPREIGVPTGLGKTSCLDVAVWSLAQQAGRNPGERTAPTRIWYVVNRRLLVDGASSHAWDMSQKLKEARDSDPHGPLGSVATALSRMSATGTSGEPLFVSRLRGGGRAGQRPPHPSQPSIICSTVPMFGSRLLFRGFGTSNRMWSVEAALAGTDSLVLLDEAHLSVPLQKLIDRLPEVDAPRSGIPILRPGETDPAPALLPAGRSTPILVTLTATGAGDQPFTLDREDLDHPVVRQRLNATKVGHLHEATRKKLPATLAELTLDHLAEAPEPMSAVIFVNSPATAREVEKHLAKGVRGRRYKGRPTERLTLTGRLRDIDTTRIQQRLLQGAGSPDRPLGPATDGDRHLVVIATQTLEVGANLDFDLLVTEMAGVRALTQRLGRLNRLGYRETSDAHLVRITDLKKPGLYGAEPDEVFERLKKAARVGEGDANEAIPLGPAEVGSTLGPPVDSEVFIPELLPAHMWEFAKTSLPPTGAAPPEVFFNGAEGPDLTVSICWRTDLPPVGEPMVPRVRSMELAEVPVGLVRDFLNTDDLHARRLSDDGTLEEVGPGGPSPGDTIVLRTSAGHYGPTGFDPDSDEAVLDGSLAATSKVVISQETLSNLTGDSLDEEFQDILRSLDFDPEEGPDPALDNEVAHRLAVHLMSVADDNRVAEWLSNRDPGQARIERVYTELRPLLHWPEDQAESDTLSDPRLDALDELSVAPTVDLSRHLAAVGELATRIAQMLGLPDGAIRAATTGAEFHDLGKADRRFQILLGNPDGSPVAKSDTTVDRWNRRRLASAWPVGGRHEAVSLQLLRSRPDLLDDVEDPALVEHLVGSHHGHGRPLMPSPGNAGWLETRLDLPTTTLTAQTNPSATDWVSPDRFARLCSRYGYWGLALLEATVRQADHVVSQVTEVN